MLADQPLYGLSASTTSLVLQLYPSKRTDMPLSTTPAAVYRF